MACAYFMRVAGVIVYHAASLHHHMAVPSESLLAAHCIRPDLAQMLSSEVQEQSCCTDAY